MIAAWADFEADDPVDAAIRTGDDAFCAGADLKEYTCADPDETLALLERFYEKADAGRAGEHETEL